MLRILLIPMWVMVFGLLGCDQEVEKKPCTGCNNNEPDCDDPRATCPPCPVELCACRQDPPDCTICLNPEICPDRPDGGTDVTDIVQPDIPDAETDPYLSMVECAAGQPTLRSTPNPTGTLDGGGPQLR